MPEWFRFYGRIAHIELNKGKFTKTFEDEVMVIIRDGARAFVRNIILRVPVWTGFTRGSIKFAQGPNGDLASFLNVAVPITGTHKNPRWYYPQSGGRIRKLPENAGQFGSYNFTNANHKYAFSFRTEVIQFLINEFYNDVSPTSPWHSLDAGRTAFQTYVNVAVKYKFRDKVKSATVSVPVQLG